MSNIDNIFFKLKLGVEEIISEKDFYNLILNKKDIIIKIGFDPTSDRLHLGHYVILKKLRDFQNFGYKLHIIIGDFTASIGDPSGLNSSRPTISYDLIKNNYKHYNIFICRFLSKDLTFFYFNSVWFNFINLFDFIQLLSYSTISRFLERSDFKNRFILNKSISLHEFIYPLLQGYDSVYLNSDIEIGGIDQKFNLLLGRDLQNCFFQKSQVLIMMPILPGLDGVNKMSKSLNNCIFLNDEPYLIFCKLMSLPDSLLKEYYLAFGFISAFEIDEYFKSKDFMSLKIDLAYKIVLSLYDSFIACDVKDKFINRVSKRDIFYSLPVEKFYIFDSFIYLFDFFVSVKFLESRSEYKRFINSLSIRVDGNVVSDKNFKLFVNNVYCIQLGKKKIIKVFLKKNKNFFLFT